MPHILTEIIQIFYGNIKLSIQPTARETVGKEEETKEKHTYSLTGDDFVKPFLKRKNEEYKRFLKLLKNGEAKNLLKMKKKLIWIESM